MKLFSQVSVAPLCLLGFFRYALAGSLAVCCSCSTSPSYPEDPMVPLGIMSGEMDMASEQRELVNVLRANGIPFGGGGSKICQFDVPASKFDLAVSILRTNPLVKDNIFMLNTNAAIKAYPIPHP